MTESFSGWSGACRFEEPRGAPVRMESREGSPAGFSVGPAQQPPRFAGNVPMTALSDKQYKIAAGRNCWRSWCEVCLVDTEAAAVRKVSGCDATAPTCGLASATVSTTFLCASGRQGMVTARAVLGPCNRRTVGRFSSPERDLCPVFPVGWRHVLIEPGFR